MKEILINIGGAEMCISVNKKLENMILQVHKRLNYRAYLMAMKRAPHEKIEVNRVEINADFFYALEDVLEENGYYDVFHRYFEKQPERQRKILFELFREDKSVRYLVYVLGYEEKEIFETIQKFFKTIKKQI